MAQANSPRIAIIGCGAIAEKYFLPAFARYPWILENLILVDRNEERARQLASRFNTRNYVFDHRDLLDEVDGVVIAVPHYLHHRISMDFLEKGIHVLCEKPLAQTSSEAIEMVTQAQKSGVTLSANYTQRLFPSFSKVKELLSNESIGKPLSIQYIWGSEFSWPTVSGFYFDSKTSSRGVLFDFGAHVLDLICWWLGEKPRLISSENDSFGGPESVACVNFDHNGCAIEVRLSWLCELRNTYMIQGELGMIESGIEDWWVLPITYNSGRKEKIKLESEEKDYFDFGRKVVVNFLDVITRDAEPLIPASSVIPSMELIDACYASASRFRMPWYDTLESSVGE